MLPSAADRDRLKVTFDTVADRYHQARPAYPDELYTELVSAAGLHQGARLLEVGCGTGKARSEEHTSELQSPC